MTGTSVTMRRLPLLAAGGLSLLAGIGAFRARLPPPGPG